MLLQNLFFTLSGALMLLGGIYLWGTRNPLYKKFKNSEGRPQKINMIVVWCAYVALALLPVWMVVAYLLTFQQ